MDPSSERKRIVNVALCGFGRAGKIHFHGVRLNHRCRLKYIVECFNLPDVHKTIRDHLEEYNLTDSGVTLVDASQYESALVSDPSLDAVIIATPTETHEWYAKTALRHRKAVFCEKPLAVALDDVAYCYDLAASLGCPLYCAFQRRFDTSMAKLREQVVAGKVGKVFQVKTTSRDNPVPPIAYLKTAGGMYHDTAVHDIDMVCWILGEEPEGVFAQGSVFNPEIRAIGDVDTAAITLKFPSGALSLSDISRHASYGYDMRVEVFGEKGMLVCENARDDTNLVCDKDGCTASPIQYSFQQRFREAYQRELDHFVDLVLDPSKPCAVTKEEVLLCGRVANACERSQKEGRLVGLDPMPQLCNGFHEEM